MSFSTVVWVSNHKTHVDPRNICSRLNKSIVILNLFLFVGSWSSTAATAILSWNRNTDPAVKGYRLHRGTTNGDYTWSLDVGPSTSVQVSGLNLDVSYFFAVTAYDSVGLESPWSSPVTVRIPGSSNRAPVANSISKSLAEDASIPVTLAGSDADGDPLTYTVTQAPLRGRLTGTPPALTYVPDSNYNGPDSFKFTVSDGKLTSSAATVSLNVTPVNDPPTAVSASLSILGVQLQLSLDGNDPDGDPLTYSITQAPRHGTLIGIPPLVIYVPPLLGLNGTDTFQFTVSDGKVTSAPATVSIQGSANRAPVASSSAVSVAEDGAISLSLNGSDPDGDPISFAVTQNPASGAISGTPPNLTYRPSPNFNGNDSLRFTTSDGKLTSAAATVSITVTPANDAPVAKSDAFTTAEGSSLSIALSGSDVDGDSVTYSITRLPGNGVVSGTPPNITYKPKANFSGSDSLQFTVSDGKATSSAATISITVSPSNRSPIANDRSLSVLENGSTSLTLTGSDPDGDSLSFSITTPPAHGTLTGNPPNLDYRPATDYSGPDTFKFTTSDGKLTSAAATVSITVIGVNSAPSATSSAASVAEDGSVAITLRGSDPEGDSLSYSVTQSPANGTLSGTPPNLTYRPNSNFNGTDALKFTVTDGRLTSGAATVSITVTEVNDTPVASGKSVTVNQGGSVAITLTGSDVDDDPLTFAISQQPADGTLTGTPPNVTYRPRSGFSGSDSFRYTARDGTATSAPATVNITVKPGNSVPVANSRNITMAEDGTLSITLSGSDADGDPLTYSVTSLPPNGVLSGTPPNLTYKPKANHYGTDSFKFTVNDGTATSSAATVSITITSVNDAPVAVSSAFSMGEDQTISITLSGKDVENDVLYFSIVELPKNGLILGTPPNIYYRPKPNYYGSDSFRFTVADGRLTSAPATVYISIAPVNDAPSALSDRRIASQSLVSNEITLAATDVDGDAVQFIVTSEPTNGVLVGTAPDLTYQPNPGASGEDSFSFVVTDGELTSEVKTVSLEIDGAAASTGTPVTGESRTADTLITTLAGGTNLLAGAEPAIVAAPAAPAPDEILVAQGGSSSVLLTGASSVLVNDATSEIPAPVTALLLQGPSHGTLAFHEDGTFTYRHFAGAEDSDSFTYVLSSEGLISAETTVTIHVLRWTAFRGVGLNTQLEFTILPGLDYYAEFNSTSATAVHGWEVLAAFTGESDGVATVMDMSAPEAGQLFYRIRCVGPHGTVIARAFSRTRTLLGLGDTSFALPFGGQLIRRALVVELNGNVVRLEGAPWVADQLAGEATSPRYLVQRVLDPSNDIRGDWWPVIANSADSIALATSSIDLGSVLQVGDLVEVRSLPSLRDLVEGAEGQYRLLQGADRLLGSSAYETTPWLLSYSEEPDLPPAYHLERDGLLEGPIDIGNTRLTPDSSFVWRRAEIETLEAIFTGPAAPATTRVSMP